MTQEGKARAIPSYDCFEETVYLRRGYCKAVEHFEDLSPVAMSSMKETESDSILTI